MKNTSADQVGRFGKTVHKQVNAKTSLFEKLVFIRTHILLLLVLEAFITRDVPKKEFKLADKQADAAMRRTLDALTGKK